MAGITLAQAEAKLSAAMTAYESALSVASYSIKDRSKTNQQLEQLQSAITYWDNMVKQLTPSSRARGRYAVLE